ncbi:MAG: HNH endonuclease [Bacteroidota bacterium]
MKTLISNWLDIVENILAFNKIVTKTHTEPLRVFCHFSNWYYLPEEDLFAPSKFIGYKWTTLESYNGHGITGTDTQEVLSKYFDKLNPDDDRFQELRLRLEQFAISLNKKISDKTFGETKSGGIYIPKKQYLHDDDKIDQELYKIVIEDIAGMVEEGRKEEESNNGTEGGDGKHLVNKYERDPKLRTQAIKIHGLICKVCGFNFSEKYGKFGKNFIEVHHLIPLSLKKKEHVVNPKKDMTVLCSNCHRMIHRDRNYSLTPDELRNIVNKIRNEIGKDPSSIKP